MEGFIKLTAAVEGLTKVKDEFRDVFRRVKTDPEFIEFHFPKGTTAKYGKLLGRKLRFKVVDINANHRTGMVTVLDGPNVLFTLTHQTYIDANTARRRR